MSCSGTRVEPFPAQGSLYCASYNSFWREPEYASLSACQDGCVANGTSCNAISWPTAGPSGADEQCTFYDNCVMTTTLTQTWGYDYYTRNDVGSSYIAGVWNRDTWGEARTRGQGEGG